MCQVDSNLNVISISGALQTGDMRRVLAAMHRVVSERGYQDIQLDFSDCTAAFAAPMLAIGGMCQKYYIQNQVSTSCILPEKSELNGLFRTTNWAHIIDPHSFDPGTYKGFKHLPVIQYRNEEQQADAVNRIIDLVLGALNGFSRGHLGGLEWSVNEITDNVLNHAISPIGGLVQLTNFSRANKRLEYVVCDVGVGIPYTLKASYADINSDVDALSRAIKEGITRDTRFQGNGLFGSYRIAKISGGYFELHSGNARVYCGPDGSTHIGNENVPFKGTLVVASIDYSKKFVLEDALNFKSGPHTPIDYLEQNYEGQNGQPMTFKIAQEAKSFGSRPAGEPVRHKLHNLLRMNESKKIVIDFEGVPFVSSSFADEVVAKHIEYLGLLQFMQRIELANMEKTIEKLVERAIKQRAQSL